MERLSLIEMSEQRQLPWTALFPSYSERLAAMALLMVDLGSRPCKLELIPISKDHHEDR